MTEPAAFSSRRLRATGKQSNGGAAGSSFELHCGWWRIDGYVEGVKEVVDHVNTNGDHVNGERTDVRRRWRRVPGRGGRRRSERHGDGVEAAAGNGDGRSPAVVGAPARRLPPGKIVASVAHSL